MTLGRLAIVLALALAPSEAPAQLATTPVGMEGRVLYRHARSDLRPAAIGGEAAVILRMAESGPDGDATLYDVRFIATTVGEHDLRDYLVDAAGEPITSGDPAPVLVISTLPEDHSGDLENAWDTPAPRTGGYRWLLVAAAVLWLAPPAVVLGRWLLRSRGGAVEEGAPEPTLADALRPLVEHASRGELPPSERARLERLLLAHLREERSVEAPTPRERLAALRADASSRPVIDALEAWLHAPAEGVEPVDVEALLAPFRGRPIPSDGGAS